MNFLIDIFLVLFILVLAYYNYKKGLIKFIFKIFSFLIAIVISFVLFKPVSYFIINATLIDENINSYVYNIVNSHIASNNKEDITTNDETSSLPSVFANYINKTIENTTTNIQNDITTEVSKNISSTIINILSFIIVYILARLILLFVNFVSDKISELPIIKQFNELGGLLYGILQSFLIIFIVLAIISVLPFDNIQIAINNTFLCVFLYNINPILWIFF